MSKIIVLDTTLRDGEQSPGCSMHADEKLEMAKQLERLNVDFIEAGFAASSHEDFNSIKMIAYALKRSGVVSLARATKRDVELAGEALKGAVRPRLHVFLATSPIHLARKLKIDEARALELIEENIRYARNFTDDVQFSCEDAFRSDRDFLVKVADLAIKSGASTVNFPDTVGYASPFEVESLFRYMREHVANADKAVFGCHNHNDLGQAVANTLAAIRGGAGQVECTVNGIGERAGNAALEEVVMAIDTRQDFYGATTDVDTTQIYRTSKMLSAITGMKIPRNKAIVGKNAFAHEAGIHQHGVMNDRSTYEIMSPVKVGVPENNMVLGKHSGKHAVQETLSRMGYNFSDDEIAGIYDRFKELTERKKNITEKDLEALITSKRKQATASEYKLVEYVITSVSKLAATAMIKLSKGEEMVEKTCRGDGPVDAAFKAINEIAGKPFNLVDYSLNAVTEGEDALGEAIIRLGLDDNRAVLGRAVSTDIIEASVLGYINAVNKLLFS